MIKDFNEPNEALNDCVKTFRKFTIYKSIFFNKLRLLDCHLMSLYSFLFSYLTWCNLNQTSSSSSSYQVYLTHKIYNHGVERDKRQLTDPCNLTL